MRLPFLRSKTPQATMAPGRGRAAAAVDDSAAVQTARTRARRRLVGALVLLLIGIAGFPVLFETQPRPLPLDTPIEVARHADGSVQQGAIQPVTQQPEPLRPPVVPPPDAGTEVAPSDATPALPAPSASVTTTAGADASASRTAAVSPAPAPTTATAGPAPTPKPSASVARPAPAPVTPPAPAEPIRPQPVVVASQPATRPAAASAALPPPVAASGAGRFVVQVGAYSDAAMLRDARGRVEKLGLKSYTQVIDSSAGKRTRVRVGPFATRQEADAVAAKVKRSGLPADILAL